MTNNPPCTFDEYERHLTETLKVWSPQQRVAFVAGLAERWLQAYEKFSAAQRQGDPAVLRQIVGAIWDHLRGRLLAPADATRFSEQINENAPDTEEFDQLGAWRALQACVILGLALEYCKTTGNTATITRTALAAFEGVHPERPSDMAGQRRAWKKAAAQEEFGKQSALLQAIGPLERFDDHTTAELRSGLGPACCDSAENSELAEEAAAVAYECVAGPAAAEVNVSRSDRLSPYFFSFFHTVSVCPESIFASNVAGRSLPGAA
jgi:uncharacterized protein YjaG (DUF416 family)